MNALATVDTMVEVLGTWSGLLAIAHNQIVTRRTELRERVRPTLVAGCTAAEAVCEIASARRRLESRRRPRRIVANAAFFSRLAA